MRRTFIGNKYYTYQHRYYAGAQSPASSGQSKFNPKGDTEKEMVNDMLYVKGRGYRLDSDGDQYLSEVVFSTPVLISNGQCFRFLYIVQRTTPSNSATASGYLVIALCNADGTLQSQSTGNRASWDSELASNGTQNQGHLVYKTSNAGTWRDIASADAGTTFPEIDPDFGAMVNSINSLGVYQACMGSSQTKTTTTITMAIFEHSNMAWSAAPMSFPSSGGTITSDIVERAKSMSNHKYWYGGGGQIATQALADSLYNTYKNTIWSKDYYNTALKDIDGTTRVSDCSHLVSYAYGLVEHGTHGLNTTALVNKYAKYADRNNPKNGMICWRSGHCGIYADGQVIQMKSQKYDYYVETYKAGDWDYILYDKNRSY